MTKQYKLKKWYPSLPEDWKGRKIIVGWLNNAEYYIPINNIYPRLLLKKDTIENNPEFWEEIKQFEVGKWYKHNKDKRLIALFLNSDSTNVGFYEDIWIDTINMTYSETWQEVTDEEVKERLLKYAKSNYPEGTKIIFPNNNQGIVYNIKYIDNKILSEHGTIYQCGKWAEIIEKPLFKDKNNNYWYKSDFKEDDVWYIETEASKSIFRLKKIDEGCIHRKSVVGLNTRWFITDDKIIFGCIVNIRKATQEEINWLKKCEKAGKYVEKEQRLGKNVHKFSLKFQEDYIKKEQKLPKSWEEYIENIEFNNKYLFHVSALRKLVVLRDIYRGDRKPDWSNAFQEKYTLILDTNNWKKSKGMSYNEIFSFQSEEIRDKFYNNFKEMLEKIKPLFQ